MEQETKASRDQVKELKAHRKCCIEILGGILWDFIAALGIRL